MNTIGSAQIWIAMVIIFIKFIQTITEMILYLMKHRLYIRRKIWKIFHPQSL